MSQTAIAQEKAFKLPMEPVDIYKMKQSPKGYLSLKAVLSDPQGEPTDLLDFHPSGDYLVSAGRTRTNIRIWDLKTQKAIKTLSKNFLSKHVLFTPDGQYLFVDYYLSPDDSKKYKTDYKALYDVKNYNVSHLDALKNKGTAKMAHFNPVSRELLIMNSRTRERNPLYPIVRAYSIENVGFKPVNESASTIYGLSGAFAWSPDGKYFAVGATDHGENGLQDNKQFIGIWDAKSLKEVRRIEDIYPDSQSIDIGSLAWSPDGQYLVVGPDDQSAGSYKNMQTGEMVHLPLFEEPLQIRSTKTGQLIKTFRGHKAAEGINAIKFLTDDVFISMGSGYQGDRLLILWSLSQAKMLEVFKVFNAQSILGFAWHKPSETLAISSGRIIQLYKFNAQ